MFAYCGNNPVSRVDRNGQFWDYVVDIGFLAWSIADVVNDPSDWKNWAGLAIDVVFAVVPFVPSGVGQVIKVSDNINDGIKIAQKATVVGETMDRVKDFAKGIGATDNLYGGFKHYNNLSNLGKVGKVTAEVAGKASNVAWLYKKLRTGYTVYDIGKDVNRTLRSSSYIVEKTTLILWENRRLWKLGIHLSLEG